MSTTHHTAITTGAAANADTVNAPLAQLDAAISSVKSNLNLSAADFYIGRGSPTLTSVGPASIKVAAWAMDDTSYECVGAGFEYLGVSAATTVDIKIFWNMASATSGDIQFYCTATGIAAGESVATTAVGTTKTVAVAGTAALISTTTVTITSTISVGDIVFITIHRNAGEGADTATGDLNFIAATVTFS